MPTCRSGLFSPEDAYDAKGPTMQESALRPGDLAVGNSGDASHGAWPSFRLARENDVRKLCTSYWVTPCPRLGQTRSTGSRRSKYGPKNTANILDASPARIKAPCGWHNAYDNSAGPVHNGNGGNWLKLRRARVFGFAFFCFIANFVTAALYRCHHPFKNLQL